METDTNEEENDKKMSTQQETRVETKAVIEHNPSTSQNRGGTSTEQRSDIEVSTLCQFNANESKTRDNNDRKKMTTQLWERERGR